MQPQKICDVSPISLNNSASATRAWAPARIWLEIASKINYQLMSFQQLASHSGLSPLIDCALSSQVVTSVVFSGGLFAHCLLR